MWSVQRSSEVNTGQIVSHSLELIQKARNHVALGSCCYEKFVEEKYPPSQWIPSPEPVFIVLWYNGSQNSDLNNIMMSLM